MGLSAGGVRGINLETKDAVIGLDIVVPRADLMVLSENGYAKRTSLAQYSMQGRAGKGVVTAKLGSTSGSLVGAAVVQAETQAVVVTNKGQAKLIRAKGAPTRNRDARMDEVFALRQGDSIATLIVPAARAEVETPPEPEPEIKTTAEPGAESEIEAAEELVEKKPTRKSQVASSNSKGKTKRTEKRQSG